MIEQLQKVLSESPFARAYGFQVVSAADGKCTVRVPYSPQFDRPDGIVAGIVVTAAADVAIWLAIKTLRGIDDTSVTTQMETHFVRSARQEAILCHAEILNAGRRRSLGIARCVTEAGDLLSFHTLTYVRR